MRNFIRSFFLAFLVLWLGAANAAETPAEDSGVSDFVEIRGFGSLGGARLSNGRYGAISSFSQQRPVRDEWSPYLDSVFGLQADVKASQNNALVFQGMWRPGDSDSPVLQFGYWENRSWPSAKIRLGRIPTPMFREMEYFHIGYAQLAVRPALPVYSKLSAISHLDGGDVRWQFEGGDWVYALQLFGGNASYTHQTYLSGYEPLRAKVDQLHGAVVKAMSGNFTFRASHTQVGTTRYESREIRAVNDAISAAASGLRAAGQAAQADLLEAYRNPLDSRNLHYSSLGIDWQPGDWQLIGEMTLLNPNSRMIGVSKAWQMTVGRSFGNITPYVLFARQDTKTPSLTEAAFAAPGLGELRDELAAVIKRGDLTMRSLGLGVRYELKSELAVKLQVEKLRWNVPYVGNENQGSAEVPRATLVSLVMDFVF